jgi:hypothetical protein
LAFVAPAADTTGSVRVVGLVDSDNIPVVDVDMLGLLGECSI